MGTGVNLLRGSGLPSCVSAPEEHKAHAPTSVTCAVVTISDSRSPESDESGKLVQDLLRKAGHSIQFYTVVKDEPRAIAVAVEEASRTSEVVITDGGTGIARRDVTIPTLAPLLDRTLPGFGELFRVLSFREIGSAAMLSGAIAGIYHGRLLFCLPGSPDACRLALEKLILPELGHAAGLLQR